MSQTIREGEFIIDMARIGGFLVQYKARHFLSNTNPEYGWMDREEANMYVPPMAGCIYRLKPLEGTDGTK